MGMAFRVEETINRPALEIWAVLTDLPEAGRWMKGVDWIEPEGVLAVGTRLVFRARGKERAAELTRFDPGRAMTLRSAQGGVIADYAYVIAPLSDEACKVTLTAHCQASGLIGRVLLPFLHVAIRMADGGQIKALKRAL